MLKNTAVTLLIPAPYSSFGRNARRTMDALNTLCDLGIAIWDYSTGKQVDLDSFEGEMMTFMRARFAQQEREQARKRTRDAMRQKATQGFVTGGRLFGYDNVRISKGQTTRVVNEAEATIIREIHERFAAGDGLRTIALALNNAHAPSPRAQQGRPNGWSSSSVREVLGRGAYRGQGVYGRTANAYDREVGQKKRRDGTLSEHVQLPQPETRWVLVPVPAIVTPELAARVDARRVEWKSRVAEAKQRARAPQNASGKYLLSGGLLICPTCSSHFEAFKAPWKPDGVYVCATRRRKPGVCSNTLALPMPLADDAVLDLVEHEALGTKFIEELLMLVDRGDANTVAHLEAKRLRLQREVDNLIGLGASGVSADTLAPAINQRQREIVTLEAQLRRPRPEQPNIDALRAALEQRAAEWRETLRSEPRVARVLLRRLVRPLTLFDPADTTAFAEWEASLTPALLDGLGAAIQVRTSPAGTAHILRPEFRLQIGAA